MRMNIIIFLFSMGALLLAACGALRTDETAAIDIDENPTLRETAAPEGTAVSPSQDPDSPVSSDSSTGSSTQSPAPYLPQAGDETMNRAQVFIDEADLLVLESFPLQFSLHLVGNLPDPCHQLRVDIRPSDAHQRVMVEAYSVADPEIFCAQVLVPFEETISLSGLPAGTHTIYLNGEKLGEIVVSSMPQ